MRRHVQQPPPAEAGAVALSGMSPAVFVPLLVVGILLLQVCIWVPLILVMRKKAAERAAALRQELTSRSASGEQTLCPPARCMVRKGHVSRPAVAALTSERVYGSPARGTSSLCARSSTCASTPASTRHPGRPPVGHLPHRRRRQRSACRSGPP